MGLMARFSLDIIPNVNSKGETFIKCVKSVNRKGYVVISGNFTFKDIHHITEALTHYMENEDDQITEPFYMWDS